MAAAKQQADKGDAAEAMKSADEVTRQFAGAPAARRPRILATLTGRVEVGDQRRRDRARDLLTQAARIFGRSSSFVVWIAGGVD